MDSLKNQGKLSFNRRIQPGKNGVANQTNDFVNWYSYPAFTEGLDELNKNHKDSSSAL